MFRRGLLAVATALTLVGVVGTQVVKAAPSAADVLSAAKGFTADQSSARFTGKMHMSMRDPDAEDSDSDLGSSMQVAMQMKGEMQDATHTHLLMNGGSEGAFEMILIGRDMYTREADSWDKLKNQKWALEKGADIGPMDMQQPDLPRLLQDALNPQVRNLSDGRTELKFAVDVPHAFDREVAAQIKSVNVTVVLDKHHMPVTMRQVMVGKGLNATIDMAFTDWGKKITIAAPSTADIDPTPDINEEAIAFYNASTAVMPARVPQGWALTYADMYDDEECSVESYPEIDFDPVLPNGELDDDNEAYFYMYLMPVDCLYGDGKTPFSVGTMVGTIDTDDGSSLVELRLDDKSAIQIDTTLPANEITNVLSALVPLDLKHPPAATLALTSSAA